MLGRDGLEEGRPVRNFGGNVTFTPRASATPRTEAEVIELLDRHAEGGVRAPGSLHSWSDVMATDGLLVDLRHFDHVEVETGADGQLLAIIGAGRQLKRILPALRDAGGLTLPSLGAITEQTLAGVISTATHGSGRSSLSHYVAGLRVAAYDPATGRARIFEWTAGTELRAARCALGLKGLILAVRMRCVRQYHVAESLNRCDSLAEVLGREAQFPLQQFILIPYSWQFFAFQRREVPPAELRQRPFAAFLYRAYKLLVIDVFFHLLVRLLHRWPPVMRGFLRRWVSMFLITDRTIVDQSQRVLTLRHNLFRHEEMEIFVPARHLSAATELIREVICLCAGTSDALPVAVAAELERAGMLAPLLPLAGTYTHHYPLFFRRVFPDDALIAMTADAEEPLYSISFFTYLAPRRRGPFYAMARVVALALARLHGARPHWGKHFPLEHDEVARLYPCLDDFRRTCLATDPRGVFGNAYARRVLGFPERRTAASAAPEGEGATG